jgi:kinesin family protein C2/C3
LLAFSYEIRGGCLLCTLTALLLTLFFPPLFFPFFPSLSERLSKSQAEGDRAQETVAINKSLLALGDVISARAKKQAHVPFRNSVLTFYLQDALSKNAKTLLIVQASPVDFNADETFCTLEFGTRARRIELKT